MNILNIDTINSKELIEYITKEVMKKIKEMNNIKPEIEIGGDRVLAICSWKKDFLDAYKDFFHIDYIEDIKENVDVSLYKYLFLEGISNKELVNIAIGLPGSELSSVVIDFILQDKKIYILNEGVEYHQYKDTSNISFYNIMKSYEEKLKCFGINFINKLEIKRLIKDNDLGVQIAPQKAIEERKGYIVEGKIITENTIRNIYQKGHMAIVIKKNSIITPLAKDYIRTNGIDILVQ